MSWNAVSTGWIKMEISSRFGRLMMLVNQPLDRKRGYAKIKSVFTYLLPSLRKLEPTSAAGGARTSFTSLKLSCAIYGEFTELFDVPIVKPFFSTASGL